MTNRIRDLDPTVVPAQPGFRIASVGTHAPDQEFTDQTKPEDVWIGYEPVIAWIVRPSVQDQHGDVHIKTVLVHAVTPEGMSDSDHEYLVAPDGSWSQPYGVGETTKDDACRKFIAAELARKANR